ncbi:MAG: phage tail tape measure protein [Clostridia bacterium]|nr:phage tail tape measure protein [Clostridia bacterium]
MAVIRNLVVKVTADIGSLKKGLQEAQDTMSNVGKQLSGAGKTMSAALTLPLAGMAAASLKAGADFEAGMSSVKAVSGATGEEMKQLEDLALKMGAETKYSAKEAASGIEELIKAGVSVKDIMGGGLKGALSLAAAGELELADAAEIASTVLNSFRADGLNVSQAADILAGAANASATSVSEMKFSLSACSAVASSVGLSFKDTSTALAAFANNGLKGSDAGTSLKTMLMNLQPSTDKQAKLFKELGLTTEQGTSAFFNAQGKLKSMADIAGLLRSSLKGLTDAQRLQAMETLFGSDAIRAANILYKEGSDGIKKMESEMMKVSAADVAAERMNNLKGSLEQLKGSIETLQIVSSKAFLPILKQLADKATILVNKYMELNPEIRKWVTIILAAVATVGPLLMILGGLSSGLSVLAGAISFIASPIGLIVVAIAVLVAGFIWLMNTNEDFRNSVLSIWGDIQATFKDVLDFIQGKIEEVLPGIKAKFTEVFGNVLSFLKSFAANAVKAFNMFINGFKGGDLSSTASGWETAFYRIGAVVSTVFNGLISVIQPVMQTIFTIVSDVVTGIWNFWNTYGQQIFDTAVSIFNGILAFVQPILAQLFASFAQFASYLTPIWEQIKTLIFSLWGVIQQLWTLLQPVFIAIGAAIAVLMGIAVGVLNGIIQALGPFIQAVLAAVNFIVNLIGFVIAIINGDWAGAWNFLVEAAKSAWSLLSNLFMTIVNLVKGFVEGIISFFKGLWYALVGGSIVPDLVNGVLSCFSNMVSGVTNFVGNLVGAVSGAFGKIGSVVGDVVGSAWNWGKNMMGNLVDGIKSMAGGVKDAVCGVADKIKSFLGFGSPTKEGPGSNADTWAPNLINMLKDGIKAGIPAMEANLQAVLNPQFRKPALEAAGTGMNENLIIDHTGTITIKGVNDKGELMGVVDLIAADLSANKDRYGKNPSAHKAFR